MSEFSKHSERHRFEMIFKPMGDVWKHFETHSFNDHSNLCVNFQNTLKHIISEYTLKHMVWKSLKPMGNFQNEYQRHNFQTLWNTLGLKTFWNTSIWKHFETLWEIFENTLKHIIWKHTIWKPLKPMGDFWNTLKHTIWKHFETHKMKTIETYGEFWKHFETHHLKIIEIHHLQFLDLINTLLYWKMNLAFLYQVMTNSDQYILYQFENYRFMFGATRLKVCMDPNQ